VALYEGEAYINSRTEVEIRPPAKKSAEKISLSPPALPAAEYRARNMTGRPSITTKEALKLDKVPSSAVIIGSGASGLEFATIWNRFGAIVTVIEMMPQVLPNEDSEISEEAERYFKKAGMGILTGVRVESVTKTPAGAEVTFSEEKGQQSKLIVEKVLISAGITPNSAGLGLEELGVETNRGFITVDEQMRTNIGHLCHRRCDGQAGAGAGGFHPGRDRGGCDSGKRYRQTGVRVCPPLRLLRDRGRVVGLTEKKAKECGYNVITVHNPLNSITSSGKALTENRGFH
jgi:dihydrolipoamide dehydrogenase